MVELRSLHKATGDTGGVSRIGARISRFLLFNGVTLVQNLQLPEFLLWQTQNVYIISTI